MLANDLRNITSDALTKYLHRLVIVKFLKKKSDLDLAYIEQMSKCNGKSRFLLSFIDIYIIK